MIQLRRAWYIAFNNLRLFFNDRLAMGMFILFPFLFIVMFNLLLGNVSSQDPRIELHLATLENNGVSQQIIQGLETKDPSLLKPGDPLVVWDKDYTRAQADVESGTLAGFLSFPSDFSQNLLTGSPTKLEIIVRADATNARAALNGLADSIISQLEAKRIEINSVVAIMNQEPGVSQADIQKAITALLNSDNIVSQSLITFQSEKVGDVKNINASSFVVPGYLVMFVFFAAAVSSVEIIRERRNHTLERLLASSVRRETLLSGIYIGMVLKGLVQIAIFWTMGVLVFHVDLGLAPWAVMLISLLTVLMSAAFSLMLSTLVRTDRAASALATLSSLLLAPLGGCWWPLFITPHWMQFLAKLTPHGWATDGFNKLLVFGADGTAVTWEMVALAAFTLGFLIIGTIKFRASADEA
jgi:ABC-type multidrug transport system permease subunit